jgi:23S rRNA-/tRNA-specific pseudouridylate synthase
MFTRGSAFREKMVSAFKTHEIEKVYLAIVDGIPKNSSGIIDNYLGKIHEYEGQSLWGTVPAHKGHHAVTAWELQKKGFQASLLRCYPKTGRTHQIRVHMSEMGHPILGDKQYGRSVHCPYNALRCLLHAYELSFIHPDTQQKMHFQAPLPQDFKIALDQLMGGLT